MNLAKWQEVAGSSSQSKLELEPGLSWAADLGVLEFDGVEAAKFLQGYLTCDTQALPPGQWQPTALCNLKGRVVSNGWVSADTTGSLWLLVHHSLAEHCLTFLSKYMVFAKAEGHNRSDTCVAIMGFQQPAPDNFKALALFTDTWLSLANVAQAIDLWQQAPVRSANTQFNTVLLTNGAALITSNSSEQYLPQMLGLATSGAIDFDKGCYLGQEIVARAQHRGSVKRQLARLQWRNPVTTQKDWEAVELVDDKNAGLGKIINWQVALDSSGELVGRALAVVSIKGDVLPSRAQSKARTSSAAETTDQPADQPTEEPTHFQVSKIEN